MRARVHVMLFAGLALSVAAVSAPAISAGDDTPREAKASPAASATTKTAPSEDAKAASAEYNRLFDEFKQILVKLRELQGQYQLSPESERPALARQFDELVERGKDVSAKLLPAAKAAYQAAPNADQGVVEFLLTTVVDLTKHEQYEPAFEISKMLIDGGFENKDLWNYAGIDAFSTNRFDLAGKWLEKAKAAGALSDAIGLKQLESVPELEKDWADEEKTREAEAKADDLPRIRLTTSKGDVVVELFENEAPNTTANFINLVEKHFYDGTPFHRVLSGFMAQGGDPMGSGQGGPGYSIACECYKPDARKHFAGSLSMANAGKDTGGSQFFLTFAPTPHLNGKHTVFGRVIEGMDVLPKLERIDPTDTKVRTKPTPDKIIKAVVERKRDHEYVPVTNASEK